MSSGRRLNIGSAAGPLFPLTELIGSYNIAAPRFRSRPLLPETLQSLGGYQEINKGGEALGFPSRIRRIDGMRYALVAEAFEREHSGPLDKQPIISSYVRLHVGRSEATVGAWVRDLG